MVSVPESVPDDACSVSSSDSVEMILQTDGDSVHGSASASIHADRSRSPRRPLLRFSWSAVPPSVPLRKGRSTHPCASAPAGTAPPAVEPTPSPPSLSKPASACTSPPLRASTMPGLSAPSPHDLPLPGLFLDLFSGASAPLSAAVARLGGARISPIDSLHGEQIDLLSPLHQSSLRRLCSSGLVRVVCAAPPCASFSRSRLRPGGPPAVRTPTHPGGIPNPTQRQKEELSRSDLLHSFTRELLSLVLLQGGVVVLENPTSSLLWLTSECKHWIRHHALSATQIAACVHGLPAAKSWTFVSNLSDLSQLASFCPHRPGFHPALSGRRDSSGQFLTRHTACYPESLCSGLASILAPFLSRDNRVVPFLDWESCLLPSRCSWPVPPARVEDGAGSVSTASWAVPSGPNCFAALRKAWTSRILSGDFLPKFRANIASGAKNPPISDSDLSPFLMDLRSCLGVSDAELQKLLHVPAGQPFRLFLLKELLSVANDPDTSFVDLLVSGVPLGVDEPMPPCPSWLS